METGNLKGLLSRTNLLEKGNLHLNCIACLVPPEAYSLSSLFSTCPCTNNTSPTIIDGDGPEQTELCCKAQNFGGGCGYAGVA